MAITLHKNIPEMRLMALKLMDRYYGRAADGDEIHIKEYRVYTYRMLFNWVAMSMNRHEERGRRFTGEIPYKFRPEFWHGGCTEQHRVSKIYIEDGELYFETANGNKYHVYSLSDFNLKDFADNLYESYLAASSEAEISRMLSYY